MTEARKIVVVGGGIAGLAAAHAAVARGRELGRPVAVTVIERSSRFGGNLQTETADGFLFDAGPDSWVATKPHATALAGELGLGGSIIETNPDTRRFLIAWGGRLHPVPEGLVLGVPTRLAPLALSRLFSSRGKLRMAIEPFVRARRFEGDDDESIADFACRRLGREAAERLVAPLLGGISAGDAADLSIRASFPQLVAMEREHGSLVHGMRAAARARAAAAVASGSGAPPGPASAFLTLAGGVGGLVAALVERLLADGVTLRHTAAVRSMKRSRDAWVLEVEDGGRVDADAVVIAVRPPVAASLLAPLDGVVAKDLASVSCGSTTTVFLGYRRADVAHPLDAVGFVVPRAMRRPLLAGTWVSSKWAARAPEGHVLVRAFLGGAWGEGVIEQGDDALVSLARGELRALMDLEAEPVVSRVFRFDKASPQMKVGHLALIARVRERLARMGREVQVAGGGYDGVGIPDCIRQGQEAVRAVL
jgi:oxygen-dependent protoporphyrinogen oxidase